MKYIMRTFTIHSLWQDLFIITMTIHFQFQYMIQILNLSYFHIYFLMVKAIFMKWSYTLILCYENLAFQPFLSLYQWQKVGGQNFIIYYNKLTIIILFQQTDPCIVLFTLCNDLDL